MRSPASITDDASARSTSSRSSVSVLNGPSRKPRPGVIALPTRISSRGIGPSTRVTRSSGTAESSATRSLCWRPRVRGATPITTKETTSMIAIEVSAGLPEGAAPRVADQLGDQHGRGDLAEQPQQQGGVEVARQVVEQRPAAGCAPARPSATSSSARARENDASAASAAENRPASTTRAAASTTSHTSAGGHRPPSVRPDRAQRARRRAARPGARTSPGAPPARRGRSRAGAGCRAR